MMAGSAHLMRLGLLASAMLALAISCKDATPDSTVATPFDAESAASAIDGAIAGMRRDTADIEGQSTEGGRVEAAYRDSALQRLRAEYFGETGKAIEEFYFDSVLFLVRRVDSNYDEPLSGRVISADTSRFDLRALTTTQVVRDSLAKEARALLDHLAAARR